VFYPKELTELPHDLIILMMEYLEQLTTWTEGSNESGRIGYLVILIYSPSRPF
jgi:hypothetical protein